MGGGGGISMSQIIPFMLPPAVFVYPRVFLRAKDLFTVT